MRPWHTRLMLVGVALVLGSTTGCAPGILWACKRPEITARSLNNCDRDRLGRPIETGIPFYLPKPLLIVSKNFRNIEEAKVGLTDGAPIPNGYDDQAKYADLNARTNFNGLNGASVSGAQSTELAGPETNKGTATASPPRLHSGGAPISPGKAPSDGLSPETFYTYQIVFVPDMTQKFGLKIRGGPGEMRAAMNLVNGWQFTGIGPFYMKDSATAQNILASGISARLGGQAAADVLKSSADLAKVLGGRQSGTVGAEDENVKKLSETLSELPLTRAPMTLVDFAEIHVYEAFLTPEGMMEWRELTHLCFNRDYLGAKVVCKEMKETAPTPPKVVDPKGGPAPTVPEPGKKESGTVTLIQDDASVAQAAVAGALGIPINSPALVRQPGRRESGEVGAVPSGGVNQIQVDCGGSGGCKPSKEFNLIKLGGGKRAAAPRARIEERSVSSGVALVPGVPTVPAAPATGLPPLPTAPARPSIGGGRESGTVGGEPTAHPPIINQPIFNNQAATGSIPPTIPMLPPQQPK